MDWKKNYEKNTDLNKANSTRELSHYLNLHVTCLPFCKSVETITLQEETFTNINLTIYC